jgi:ankyrin repeat protein
VDPREILIILLVDDIIYAMPIIMGAKNSYNKYEDTKITDLFKACANNDEAMALLLLHKLDMGAINSRNKKGETVLMHAVQKGMPKLVDALLNNGANINSQDNYGHTALIYVFDTAYLNPMTSIIAIRCFNEKFNVDLKNKYGLTLLHQICSIEYAKGEEMASCLLNKLAERRADINAVNLFGRTALMMAARSGNNLLVGVLIKLGANMNMTETQLKQTALILAIDNNKEETAKLLVTLGADINAVDAYSRTAITWACYKNMTGLVKLLIEKGANIDLLDMYKYNCLQYACVNNNKELMRYFGERYKPSDPMAFNWYNLKFMCNYNDEQVTINLIALNEKLVAISEKLALLETKEKELSKLHHLQGLGGGKSEDRDQGGKQPGLVAKIVAEQEVSSQGTGV